MLNKKLKALKKRMDRMVLQYINKAGHTRTVTTGASNTAKLITLILMMGCSITEVKEIR